MSVINNERSASDEDKRSLSPSGVVAEHLEIPDADVVYYPGFFAPAEADEYLEEFATNIGWQQEAIKFYGKSVPLPRLTAWYGETAYTYSGVTHTPQSWTPALLQARRRIEAVAQVTFNSVLLNFYRNGQDSVSWHSDDEPELGTNPVIASVSFGAARNFQFKHKSSPEWRAKVELTHGSLLLMQGATQHFWKHQIPKSATIQDPRINLTFRIFHKVGSST